MKKGTSFDIPKKDGTVQNVHIVSDIFLFFYEAEIWYEEVPTQINKATEGKFKLENKMYVLQGDETPEKLTQEP